MHSDIARKMNIAVYMANSKIMQQDFGMLFTFKVHCITGCAALMIHATAGIGKTSIKLIVIMLALF